MTHPGLDTAALSKVFTWQYHWQEELESYLAAENKKLLQQEKIVLTNFGGLD